MSRPVSARVHAVCVFAAVLLLPGCMTTKATGVVVDEDGMPVEGAVITVGYNESNQESTTTNAEGEFSVRLVDVCLPMCMGMPRLTATKEGHQTLIRSTPQGKTRQHRVVLKRIDSSLPPDTH